MSKAVLQDVYLRPGEIFFGKGENVQVRTLLGSCVALTLWHPQRHFGGMCHVTMPTRHFTGPLQSIDTSYADEAMRYFMSKLALFQLSPSDMKVGMYGGGAMFDTHRRGSDIGAKNIRAVQEQIELHGFKLGVNKTGANLYRKIWLSLADGQVRLVEESVK